MASSVTPQPPRSCPWGPLVWEAGAGKEEDDPACVPGSLPWLGATCDLQDGPRAFWGLGVLSGMGAVCGRSWSLSCAAKVRAGPSRAQFWAGHSVALAGVWPCRLAPSWWHLEPGAQCSPWSRMAPVGPCCCCRGLGPGSRPGPALPRGKLLLRGPPGQSSCLGRAGSSCQDGLCLTRVSCF